MLSLSNATITPQPIRCLVAIALWGLSMVYCAAQPTRLYFHHLTTKDGFSEGYNPQVFRDSKGYIWFGSDAGAGWHNGQKIEMLNTFGILGHGVTSSFWEDTTQQLLWFSTEKGINCYRRKQNDFVQIAFPVEIKRCQLIYHEAISGRLWALANNQLWRIDPVGARSNPAQYQMYALGSLPSGSFFCPMTEAQTGAMTGLLIAEESQKNSGLQAYQIQNNQLRLVDKHLAGPKGLTITSVLAESANIVWISTYQGILKYDLKAKKVVFSDFKIGQTLDILRYDFQHLLLATDRGICVYNTTTQQAERFFSQDAKDPNSLISNEIGRIYLDQNKTLWASTWDGVDFANLDKIKFETIPNEAFGQDFRPKSLSVGMNGQMLFGTDFTSGLFQRGPLGDVRKLPISLNTSLIFPISEHDFLISVSPYSNQRSNGSRWYDFSSGNLRPIRLKNGDSPAMTAFCLLRDGRVLSGGEQGLFLIRKTQENVDAELLDGSMPNISLLAQDSIGRVLVGCKRESIVVLESRNGTLTAVDNIPVNGDAKTFAETAQFWWFGGEFGLLRVSKTAPSNTRLFTVKDGLPNDKVYGALTDSRGDLWLSTNKGLAYFHVADSTFHTFTLADGLQGFEFNTNSFCRAYDGYFWFGGMGGFNRFHPDSVLAKCSKRAPSLVLNDLTINYKPYREVLKNAPANPDDLTKIILKLDYDENNLQFSCSALEFCDPNNQTIYYQLTLADEQPNENKWAKVPGAYAVIRYEQLSPGRYKLYLSAANSDGNRFKPLIMEILISPPIYQEPWFIFLIALVALIAGLLFTRQQFKKQLRWSQLLLIEKDFEIQKLRAIDAEKKRIADEMHDDLGGVLTTIVKMLERLFEDPKYAEIGKPMKEIAEKADTAMKNMRHIIWALESGHDTLADTLGYIVENSAKFLQANQLDFVAHTLSSPPKAVFTGGQRRRIFLAVQEVLHNVVKHAQAKTVFMTMEKTEKAITISIRDNGVGIPRNVEPGRGTGTLRKNMDAVGGSVEVSSSGNGTEVVLQFPIVSPPPKPT